MNSSPPADLMQQMGLSMREIDRRLHMFNFTETDRALLRNCADRLGTSITSVVDTFYEHQLADPEIAAMIGEPGTFRRLRAAMERFIKSLFRAEYDKHYVNSRLRIGSVHKTLNVTPKLYMSAVAMLQNVLDEAVDTHFEKDTNRRAVKAALHKALLFDSQLVFDAYIDSYQQDMEDARAEVNRYASHLKIKVEALTRQLHEQSIRDSLTGLYNRQTFLEYLQRELGVAERYRLPLCLAYFDLNGFKQVNDNHGHEAGDEVLRQVGRSLLAITRSVDIGSRYGGDEFCIIMPRCDLEGMRGPLQRLVTSFDSEKTHDVTFSVGVVQIGPEEFMDAETLINEADTLMYRAKERSRQNPGHHVEKPNGPLEL